MVPTQPQNLDGEAALLGVLISESDAIKNVADILRPEHFTREFNGRLYEVCLSLYRDNIPIDNISVANRYDEMGERKFAGQRAVIATLMVTASYITTSNARHYAQNLIDLWKRRQALKIHQQGMENISDLSKPLNSSLATATERLFALGIENEGDGVTTLDSDALPEALRRLEAARRGEGDGSIAAYPWGSVAGLVPLRRGEVTVVCGRPGSGKSSWILNVILEAAKNKIPAAIFSLEMSKVTLTLRLISHMTGINSRRIERGETNDEEHGLVCQKIAELAKLPIFIDDKSELDELKFITKARDAHQLYGIGIIVLDYLQLMTRKKDANDATAVESCARTVRKTARLLNIPIIEVSQVSRNCEYREDKRPILADLRESGGIEQEADIVLALFREDYYERDKAKHTGKCEVIVRKHRNGDLGTRFLLFTPENSKFVDINWAYK